MCCSDERRFPFATRYVCVRWHVVVLLAALAAMGHADCLITRDGKVYYDVRGGTNNKNEDTVTIVHRTGVVKIACTNLYNRDKLKYACVKNETGIGKEPDRKAAVPPPDYRSHVSTSDTQK